MPKKPKQASLPDLKTRFGWLPGGNKVDPQIYTQLDPTAKKPLPDFPTQDVQAPQSDSSIVLKKPPGTGGGGPGGGTWVTPPPPPPPPPPPTKPPPDVGQEWKVDPPVTKPPGIPVGIPPTATPSDPNKNTSTVTYPPASPPPPGIPPVATPSPVSTELTTSLFNPIPGGNPFPPPVPPHPVSMDPPSTLTNTDSTATSTDSNFSPYQGDDNGPTPGPPLGGSGWTLPGDPPVPPGNPPPGGTTDETIDYGEGAVPADAPLIDDTGGDEEDGGAGDSGGGDKGGGPTDTEEPEGSYDFARGGIVMKPTIARVGERGPEGVMKLGPRMPGGWEVPMRPGKLPYPRAMSYKRRSEFG